MADAEIQDDDDLETETLDEAEIETGEDDTGQDEGEDGEQGGREGAEPGNADRGLEGRGGRKPSSAIIQELKNERREMRRQLEELRQGQQQQQQHRQPIDPYAAQREAALEQERLALMPVDEKVQYLLNKHQQHQQAEMQRMRFDMMDQADRAEFNALTKSDSLAAKHAAEVEKLIAQERSAGRNVSRITALDYVIGRSIREKAASQTTRQRKIAGARVASQTTTPRNQGSMSRERGGNDKASLERRLENVII